MSELVFKTFVYLENDQYNLCYDDCRDCKKDCFEAVVKIIPVFRDTVHTKTTNTGNFKKDTNIVIAKLNSMAETLRSSSATLRKLKR